MIEFVIRPQLEAEPYARFTNANEAIAEGNRLAGRTITAYCIGQAHANRRRGRTERAYVSANRGSPARDLFPGQGFIIEVVRQQTAQVDSSTSTT